MVIVFQLKNPENGKVVEVHEVIILELLQISKRRNKKLGDILEKKLETLYNKKINDSMFDY